jgi:flavorubredoxin
MRMDTDIDEVADGIFRVSTFVESSGLPMNQYLIDGDEPLLFHTGHRALFPDVSQAVSTVIPLDRLRWISFGHFEADECGSMNQWLGAAASAQPVHGIVGVLVSLNDQADREPRTLSEGEVLDIGGKRLRWIPTPHVPHGWDAGLLFEETTGTLFAGDLFTMTGRSAVASDADIVERAIATEDLFNGTALTADTGATIRSLATLEPKAMALMHGPLFTGDGAAALTALGDDYDRRVGERIAARDS